MTTAFRDAALRTLQAVWAEIGDMDRVDEMGGLDSIVNLSSGNTKGNYSFVKRRKLGRMS